MKQLHYSEEKIKAVPEKVQRLISIVAELETDFPGRHFTLDGHLVGSIGEVMAAYYYGIDLYEASAEKHDGEVDGRKVQIKITQQDNVLITKEPDYLIVLYLTKSGTVYEVYNGRGKEPVMSAGKPDSHNYYHLRVNKLMELDAHVLPEDRIPAKHLIEKMKIEYKNRKTGKK